MVEWKIDELGIPEPGAYKNRAGAVLEHDGILPKAYHSQTEPPHIYTAVHDELRRHRSKNRFRYHLHFFHVASSQAANINLFLPILLSPHAAKVLRACNVDFAELDTTALDKGYCIEFWGGNFVGDGLPMPGPLGDKTDRTGTDSDIAIAYRNFAGERCLWLIEHKLTEAEFAMCGGATSDGRAASHDCSQSLADILRNKALCYYHDAKHYSYWTITEDNLSSFPTHSTYDSCPFQRGMNQLWRNQLLGLALERLGYKQVKFSVVKHPSNRALDPTLYAYALLTAGKARFSVATSDSFVSAAEQIDDAALRGWAKWYRRVYLP